MQVCQQSQPLQAARCALSIRLKALGPHRPDPCLEGAYKCFTLARNLLSPCISPGFF
jgi:hypothetical protein